LDALRSICLQLLLPFAAGQLARRWLGAWLDRNKSIQARYDQAVILLIVYTAFSQSVANGLWQKLPLWMIGVALLLCVLLLFTAFGLIVFLSRRLGFSRADEIAAV